MPCSFTGHSTKISAPTIWQNSSWTSLKQLLLGLRSMHCILGFTCRSSLRHLFRLAKYAFRRATPLSSVPSRHFCIPTSHPKLWKNFWIIILNDHSLSWLARSRPISNNNLSNNRFNSTSYLHYFLTIWFVFVSDCWFVHFVIFSLKFEISPLFWSNLYWVSLRNFWSGCLVIRCI